MPSRKPSRKPKAKAKATAKPQPQPRPRPVPKPLESAVVLQSQHSFDLVHTAIAATMFEVIFARKVFPIGTKWHKRYYDPANPDTAYETFVSGTQAPKEGSGVLWHVPVNGQFLVLDKLMEALENGVKDALANSYLRKIDLSFHSIGTEPLSESNCIESYGLHISYGPSNMPYIDTELRNSQGSQTTSMNVLEGKTNLKEMVNGIARHFLSSKQAKVFKTRPLPSNIRVSLQAEYTAQTPSDYHPLGFKPVKEIVWKKDDDVDNREPRYNLATGFHSVAFTFRPPGNRAQTAQTSRDDTENAGETAPRVAQRLNDVRSMGGLRAINRVRALSQFSASDGGHTQPEILRQIRGIHFSRLDHDSRHDTQQYFTSPLRPTSEQPYSSIALNAELYIPRYIPEILDIAKPRFQALIAQGDGDLDAPQSVQIDCHCGVREHSGRLVQCLQCHIFHHGECYGYLSEVPRAEFCYTCARDLFDININLRDRKFDCQLRRTIRFFQNGPARTLSEVLTHLGMETDERSKSITRPILEELVSEGFIVEQVANSSFDLVLEKVPLIPNTFFNPCTGIYHLFSESDTPLVEDTGSLESIEGPNTLDFSSTSDVPRTPTSSYPPKQYRTLRTMQHSSRREVSVDDATTQSAVSTPAHQQGYGTRQLPSNSELQTVKLGGSNTTNGITTPDVSNPDVLRENSGNKRVLEFSQQGRSSRRKMK